MKPFIIISLLILLSTSAHAQDSIREKFRNAKSTQVHQLQLDQTWSCSSGNENNRRPTENKVFKFMSGSYYMNDDLIKVGRSATVLVNQRPEMFFRTDKEGNLIIEHVEMIGEANQRQQNSISLPKSFIVSYYETCLFQNMNRGIPSASEDQKQLKSLYVVK